jgi:hypothetical protein
MTVAITGSSGEEEAKNSSNGLIAQSSASAAKYLLATSAPPFFRHLNIPPTLEATNMIRLERNQGSVEEKVFHD